MSGDVVFFTTLGTPTPEQLDRIACPLLEANNFWVGAGALAGHQIQVDDGQPREQSVGLADKAKSFFKTAGKVLACIVLAPIALPMGLTALALV